MTSKVPSHPNNSIISTVFPKSVPNSADPTDLRDSTTTVPSPAARTSLPVHFLSRCLQWSVRPRHSPVTCRPRTPPRAQPRGRAQAAAGGRQKAQRPRRSPIRSSSAMSAGRTPRRPQRPFRRAGPGPRRGRSAVTSTAASARPEVAGEGRAAILDAGARCQASRWRRRRAGAAGKGRAVTAVTGARPGLRVRHGPAAEPPRRPLPPLLGRGLRCRRAPGWGQTDDGSWSGRFPTSPAFSGLSSVARAQII